MGSMSRETQVSASDSCDYPPPVCDPGPGHIGQGRIFLRTYRLRDASSQGRMIPEKTWTHRNGIYFLSLLPIQFVLYCMYCAEGLYCKRPIQCLASSEILTPTPSPPGECVPPCLWCGGSKHTLGGEGVGGQ